MKCSLVYIYIHLFTELCVLEKLNLRNKEIGLVTTVYTTRKCRYFFLRRIEKNYYKSIYFIINIFG